MDPNALPDEAEETCERGWVSLQLLYGNLAEVAPRHRDRRENRPNSSL